jgi:hypothetical protein
MLEEEAIAMSSCQARKRNSWPALAWFCRLSRLLPLTEIALAKAPYSNFQVAQHLPVLCPTFLSDNIVAFIAFLIYCVLLVIAPIIISTNRAYGTGLCKWPQT